MGEGEKVEIKLKNSSFSPFEMKQNILFLAKMKTQQYFPRFYDILLVSSHRKNRK